MLRDCLTALPGVGTWPCDEINYIWRYGNASYPSDELTAEMTTPRIRRYIRRQFGWVARRYGAQIVVEKTCANSLRIGFVERILPEGKYLFIVRNGLDAVASAMKRWKAPLDISYLARKARFVPVTDLPYYGSHFLWNRFYRLFSFQERLAFWGPKLKDMDKLLSRHSLDEVCAIQWKRCVDLAAEAFCVIPKERWLEVRYETFVNQPYDELLRIIDFLNLDISEKASRGAVANVKADSIGKGRAELAKEAIQRLMPLIQDTMDRYDYV